MRLRAVSPSLSLAAPSETESGRDSTLGPGRKARYRRRLRVQEQLHMKAAAENFATMARQGLDWTGPAGWAVA
jgi:hypothetical protein